MRQASGAGVVALAQWGAMSEADLEAVFDADYAYFMRADHTADFNRREAGIAMRAAGLQPGMRVLDAGCGYGRIALEMARYGMSVHGVDRSRHLIELARTDAACHHLPAGFEVTDLRHLTAHGAYDAALMWFTTFGYTTDPDSHLILRLLHRALRPGGRLLIDALNPLPQREQAAAGPVLCLRRVGADFMLDEITVDDATGRLASRRTVVRDRTLRTCHWSMRLLDPHEWERWLHGAGFTDVRFLGDAGEPFTLADRRLLVTARTPGPPTAQPYRTTTCTQ